MRSVIGHLSRTTVLHFQFPAVAQLATASDTASWITSTCRTEYLILQLLTAGFVA